MSDVFVRDDQKADVKFYIKAMKDSVRLVRAKDFSEMLASERADFQESHVYLKPLTWGKSCELQSKSYTINPMTNQRVFDSDKYVQMKLMAIIDSWSFTVKNIKGDDIPVKVTEENINSLFPVVADFILKEYNDRFEPSETERKNS